MVLMAGASLRASSSDENGDKTARAAKLMEQARAAIGGDGKLNAVATLAVSGKSRQVVRTPDGEDQVEGAIELSFMLPDKYKRVDTTSVAGGMAEIERIGGFNGDETFADARSIGGHGHGGAIMVRAPSDNPQAQAAQARNLRREFARLLIGWLLQSPSSLSAEFSYAGEAETKDGKADAIDVKGADGFSARLFLDKQTHKPLMMSYRASQPRAGMIMRTLQGSPEEAEKRRKEIQEEAQRQPSDPPLVDVEVYFSDHRAVDGLLLPHRITRATGGQFSEEWEIKKFKVNPSLKATDFKK
jgi:hypothetical protein